MGELRTDQLRQMYIKHRLAHLPNGGNYLTVHHQGSFIDVQDIPKSEFDQWLATVKAEAWREGTLAGYASAFNGLPCEPSPYQKEEAD